MVTGLLEEVELMCWVEMSVVVVVVVVGKLPLELVEIAEIPLVRPIIQKKRWLSQILKKGKLNTLQQQQQQQQQKQEIK